MNQHPNHVNHAQIMLSGIPFSGVFRSAIIEEENLKIF
jgi:hypothetical protein